MSESGSDASFDRALRPPFVTYALCALCGLTFFWQIKMGIGGSTLLGYPGFVDSLHLWGGEYWGLWTSFFLHAGVVHLVFNLYWLYHFGTAVESYVGWRKYLAFWVVGTAVSNVIQLAVAGVSGVGASGFVYALFGLIWIGKRGHPYLARLVDAQTTIIFIVWLLACFVLTWTGLLRVGNGAHLGGLLFGGMCAYAFLVRNDFRLQGAALAITVLSFVPLFYAPWVGTWNLAQGFKAYNQGNFQRAADYISQVRLPQYDEYNTEILADCYSQLDRPGKAVETYKQLFAKYGESKLSAPGRLYNGYAWILATSPDATVRNPAEAIRYAQMACDEDGNENTDELDTMAAAHAISNQFDQAVTWEQKAIDADSDPAVRDELKARLKLYQAHKAYIETPSKPDVGGAQ